jgi:branched-chain amino acid aminotransferase
MVPAQVIVNGRWMPGDAPAIDPRSRAFHYGDGVFESIRVIDGKPRFLDAHWSRLAESLKVLRISMPRGLDRASLERFLVELSQRSGIQSGRGRLTVHRDASGHYRPAGNDGAFVVELHAMAEPTYLLNDHGYTVDIYPEMRKPVNVMAVHKTLNGLFYIMASLWSKERELDDCLLQNDRGNIIESSSGNLFIVSNGVLYTPALSDGCIGGVMRMQVINLALAHGIKVYECSLNPQNLLAADELFFTNAIRGIQWVASYRTKRYTHRMSSTLMDLLAAQALS